MHIVKNEAKKTWCPMSRSGAGGTNRGKTGDPLKSAMCVGKVCAAWRPVTEDTGYCGIGGKP